MRIGTALPQFGPLAEPHLVAGFAVEAERMGYDALWAADRALTPLQPSEIYPGCTPEQPWPVEQARSVDPIVTLTAAAAVTTRVRLATSTLDAPWHTPLLLGRSLTSLDLLSQGRLDIGFGVGWMRSEYEALGVPWSGRGARLEEILDVFQAMWTSDPVEHQGKLWQIPPSRMDLRPFQKPGPPVLLAGFVAGALDRIGRRGDGWLPVTVVGDGPDLETLEGPWQVIKQRAEVAGRDPSVLRRELRVNIAPGHPVESAVPVLQSARELGYDGAFLDLTYNADSVDHALKIAADIVERYRKG
ncbi:TIGR03619 family F420-dependent LLM class oxidoreductase [Streptomyces sp. NPDC051954]|uniref:TIGR03619 family F420-dependent LLM class oxidoreductase n=1 Tax=unclassified Streptomyces TaxID=2593676 RepID=UPI0034386ACA